MQDLTVTIIQSSLHWQNSWANLAMFEEKIWKIEEKTDLIILPEMFTTGFTMNAMEHAEPMNLTSFKWMRQMAEQTGAVITGSIIIKEENHFYNRLIWMQPDGLFSFYDKRHLFRMAEEHKTYSSGEKKLITKLKGWNICPLICYDLRFPTWSRNVDQEYDLLIFVANWPEARRHPWRVLLQARAIENLSYVIGVNRVKEDGKGIPYSGDSAIINFKGEHLFECSEKEIIHTQTLSYADLKVFREKFPAHLDADEFIIKA